MRCPPPRALASARSGCLRRWPAPQRPRAVQRAQDVCVRACGGQTRAGCRGSSRRTAASDLAMNPGPAHYYLARARGETARVRGETAHPTEFDTRGCPLALRARALSRA